MRPEAIDHLKDGSHRFVGILAGIPVFNVLKKALPG